MRKSLKDCIVLMGPDLDPYRCARFEICDDQISKIDCIEPVSHVDAGSLVIIPGLYNSHTHMGDSFLPDGATGLTLEEGFFRPNGMKYKELAKIGPEQHLQQLCNSLSYMARTGTICHLDFREQGPEGAELLREASRLTGVDSIILGQFDGVPFDVPELEKNKAPLSPDFLEELNNIFAAADGFSESTINDLTDNAWRTIVEISSRLDKMRAIHCLENEAYRDVSVRISGKGDLQRAIEQFQPDIIVHMTVANQQEIELLVRSETTAVLNPRANANLGLPLPPIFELMRSGANLLLGTDNGLLNSPNMFAEMDFTYKVAKSQSLDPKVPEPSSILRMATSNIRPVLAKDHYGYLSEGLPASFVVVDFYKSHLARSRHITASTVTRVTPEDILGTFRMGKPLYCSPNLETTFC